MKDAVVGAKAAAQFWKVLKHLSEKKTKDFERERDEMFREWTSELAYAMKRLGVAHVDLDQRIEELAARLEEPAYLRAIEILEREASLEPTTERRRMLAFAAAGWANVDLSTAQLSRVLHVVREVSPDDIRLLHTLSQHGNQERPLDAFKPSDDGAERHHILVREQPAGDILVASGCVALRYTTGLNNKGPEAHVTAIGRWVLTALDVFVRAVLEDDEFPRRPLAKLAESLPPGADRDRIAGYQELADAYDSLKKASQ